MRVKEIEWKKTTVILILPAQRGTQPTAVVMTVAMEFRRTRSSIIRTDMSLIWYRERWATWKEKENRTLFECFHQLRLFLSKHSTPFQSILINSTASYLTQLFHSTISFYSILFHSNLHYSTLLYSTLLYSTLLYSTLLYSTLLYSTLLVSPIPLNDYHFIFSYKSFCCPISNWLTTNAVEPE